MHSLICHHRLCFFIYISLIISYVHLCAFNLIIRMPLRYNALCLRKTWKMSIDTLKCSFQFYAKYSNRVSLTVTQNPCAYHARALFRDCHWNWNSFFIVGTNTQKRYDIHIKHSFIATSTLQPIIWHTCDVKDIRIEKTDPAVMLEFTYFGWLVFYEESIFYLFWCYYMHVW